jgi:two-component system response regulator MprA
VTGAAGLVFIVEDDPSVRTAVERVMSLEGYRTEVSPNGADALERIGAMRPDVAIVDVMMPFIDGLEVCRRLRARGDRTPVLLLTARHEVGDRVAGLDAGADDYLVKPFAVDELLARVRALLRRRPQLEPSATVGVADLVVDTARREARRGDRRLELTKTEFDLLTVLAEQHGIVLSRDYLYEHIWGYHVETSSKSLDVYVGYLRRKLEEAGEPRLLHTVRGVGYVLREQE